MVGRWSHDLDMLKHFSKFNIRYLAKDTNANTLTHYVAEPLSTIKKLTDSIRDGFPMADIMIKKVSLVSVIGSNMADTSVLPGAVNTLDKEGIKILAIHKCMRDIDIQFVIEQADFNKSICVLHKKLIEENG